MVCHHAASIQPQTCGAIAAAKCQCDCLKRKLIYWWQNGCDARFRAQLEEFIRPVCVCRIPGLIRVSSVASADAECGCRKNPNLLSATDADDPAGCAAQRARARQSLHAC